MARQKPEPPEPAAPRSRDADRSQQAILAKSDRVRAMNSPLIQMLAEVLERGRKEGVFRAGIDPIQLYISIAGLAYFYLSNNHTLSAIFGRNLMTAKARNERLSHSSDVILGYALNGCPRRLTTATNNYDQQLRIAIFLRVA